MADPVVLVLNADYRPLSWFPLSVCTWQSAIKALFLGRVDVVETYDMTVNSPTMSLNMPSVVVLKDYVPPQTGAVFTRRNLLLRDMYTCQYCGKDGHIHGIRKGRRMTLDHVVPKSKGGPRGWMNMVASCGPCNTKKGSKTIKAAGMVLARAPYKPSMKELWTNSLRLAPDAMPLQWHAYLKPDTKPESDE